MKNCQYFLLLADIHANEAALIAVMNDASQRYAGKRLRIWFLGDLFGRGPQPVEVWRTLNMYRPAAFVVGNHDLGVTGRYQTIFVNGYREGDYGRDDWQVILDHRQALSDLSLLKVDERQQPTSGEVYDFLQKLPVVNVPSPGIYLVHGGLERPFEEPEDLPSLYNRLVWEYVKSKEDANHTITAISWLYQHQIITKDVISLSQERVKPYLIIVGHYHLRIFYNSATDQWEQPVQLDQPYEFVAEQLPVLISPGSVGFPREDNDRDASYAVLTVCENGQRAVTYHKVAYDRHQVRLEMKQKAYPEAIIHRLRLSGETERLGNIGEKPE